MEGKIIMTREELLWWQIKKNPTFWEDNGYKKTYPPHFHYYGSEIARINMYPVYVKKLYICRDMEDEALVELFPCEVGVIKHSHLVAIHTWNNSGGTKFSLDAVRQVLTVEAFNEFIMEYLGDNLEDGSFILRV